MINVIRDDSTLIRQTCEQDHYLHRYPDPRSLPFGYRLIWNNSEFAPDNRPWGIVVFKKPQHHKQIGLFGYPNLPTSWQVLDLARVWVHPLLQGSSASGHSLCVFSQMVSKAIKRVQWDWLEHHPPRYPDLPYHIELIISYCELQHHDGTSYRASNFQKLGLTSDKKKDVYFRRLSAPLKRWKPTETHQPPLFAGIPILHF